MKTNSISRCEQVTEKKYLLFSLVVLLVLNGTMHVEYQAIQHLPLRVVEADPLECTNYPSTLTLIETQLHRRNGEVPQDFLFLRWRHLLSPLDRDQNFHFAKVVLVTYLLCQQQFSKILPLKIVQVS